jgi:hypothetical protein
MTTSLIIHIGLRKDRYKVHDSSREYPARFQTLSFGLSETTAMVVKYRIFISEVDVLLVAGRLQQLRLPVSR